ncbi:hypothetical protein ACQBAR_03200 [Propionibacteriaceae bacterium Y1685]|uniref:hypothetical protein n=1 Tax=Microlunatus sp. Y1700 TaxID=3418487 RepID=UPI003B7BD1AC
MINNSMSRRRFAGLAFGLAAAGSAAGCVQVPKPISATPPSRPTVDAADVPAILKHYEEAYAKAAKSYDLNALAKLEAQPIAQGTLHHFGLNKKFKTTPDEVPTLVEPEVFSTAAGDFPRRFFALSRAEAGDDDDYRVLTLHQRRSSTDAWQLVNRVWLPSDSVPDFVRDRDGLAEVVPNDSKEFGTAPGDLPDLIAEAMQNPKSKAGQQMAATDDWKRAQKILAEDRRSGDPEGVNTTISVRPKAEVTAFRTADGAAALVVVEYVTSWNAEDNWIVRYRKDSTAVKYYPGEYKSLINREQRRMLVTQGADEKVHIVGMTQLTTGVEAVS